MKILVPVDGSNASLHALAVAIERAKAANGAIHVLHVEALIPGYVAEAVGSKAVKGFHEEEAEKALGPARKLLDDAGIRYEAKWRTGHPAETIAAYAREKGCTEIVMGSRGLGRISGLLLGSVTTQVLSLVDIPVTLVK